MSTNPIVRKTTAASRLEVKAPQRIGHCLLAGWGPDYDFWRDNALRQFWIGGPVPVRKAQCSRCLHISLTVWLGVRRGDSLSFIPDHLLLVGGSNSR
jgi:hypothetical protein